MTVTNVRKWFIVVLLFASSHAFSTAPNQRTNTVRRPVTNNNFDLEKTTSRYIATCIPGLAPVLADELEALGAFDINLSGNSAVGQNRTGSRPDPIRFASWRSSMGTDRDTGKLGWHCFRPDTRLRP